MFFVKHFDTKYFRYIFMDIRWKEKISLTRI